MTVSMCEPIIREIQFYCKFAPSRSGRPAVRSVVSSKPAQKGLTSKWSGWVTRQD